MQVFAIPTRYRYLPLASLVVKPPRDFPSFPTGVRALTQLQSLLTVMHLAMNCRTSGQMQPILKPQVSHAVLQYYLYEFGVAESVL